MSGLPDGWEADYDGTRWFYRYKSTGIVQYQFPKEGDEFPEWFDGGGDDIPLEPEAWLASEQQMRRKSTLVLDPDNPGESSPAKPASNRRKKSETIPEDEQMSATGYFDPSSFMYFGPGGDISPVGDDNDANSIASGKKKGETPTQSAGPTPSTVHSHVSPLPGLPAELAQNEFVAELPEHPVQLWKPTGYVAELPTLDTVKCAEELAPIEMDATSHIPTPIQTNCVDSGPVELPTHRSPVEPKRKEPEIPAEAMASPPVPSPPAHQTASGDYPLVSASFAYPPVQRQPSGETIGSNTQSPQRSPPPVVSHEQAPAASPKPYVPESEPIKYQPWTPPQGVAGQSPGQSKRSSLVLSGVSILQSQESELGPIRKISVSKDGPGQQSLNHPEIFTPPRDPRARSDSVPASNRLPLNTPPRSPIPASLQPAGTQNRVSLPDVPDLSKMNTTQQQRHDLPGASARHESISAGTPNQIAEFGNSHAHPRALIPASQGSRQIPSPPDVDARRQGQTPPGRSATAFSAYNPSQRPPQSSPLAPEGSQSGYQRPPMPAGEWSSGLDRPIPPPGPRRLHTEPNLPIAASANSPETHQHHGPQELSSESVRVPPTEKFVLTDSQRAHITQASPPIPVVETSSNRLPYPVNDNAGVPDVRPLSLTRSKSPSPETRSGASFDAQNRALRGMSTDILSEVMSVMEESMDSSRRLSGNVSVVSPAPSDATQHRPSEVSLLSQDTGTSISSMSGGHPPRERDSLSVPSELDSSHISPLASPIPSRQQSLSTSAHQPVGHGTDPRRASIPIDGSASPRHQVSPLPLRQQLASSPKMKQQQVPPANDLPQSSMSSGPQVADQHRRASSNHASPTQAQASVGSYGPTSPLPQASSPHLQQVHAEACQNASATAPSLQQNAVGDSNSHLAIATNDITTSGTMFVQPEPPQTHTLVPEIWPVASNSVFHPQRQPLQSQAVSGRQQSPQHNHQQPAPGLHIQHGVTQTDQVANVPSGQGADIVRHNQAQEPQYTLAPTDVPPVKVENHASGSQPPSSENPSQPEQPAMSLPFGVMMLSQRQPQEQQRVSQRPVQKQATVPSVTAASFAPSTTMQQQQVPLSSSEPQPKMISSPIPPRESSYEQTTAAVPASSVSRQQATPQAANPQSSNADSPVQSQMTPEGYFASTQNITPSMSRDQTADASSTKKPAGNIPLSTPTGKNTQRAEIHEDSEQVPQVKQESPKPFPMLPGQVTPLPSQVGSAPVPLPTPPAPMSPTSPRHDSTSSQVSQMTPQNTGPSQLQQTVSNQSNAAHSIVQTAPAATHSNPPNGFAQQPSQQWQGQGMQQGQMPQYQQAPQQQWHQATSPGLPQSASNSSITDAGKSMKKWAKKMFSSEKLSSQTQQAVPSPPLPTQVNNMPQQTQMYRPPGFQQMPGQAQQVPGQISLGKMPQVPVHNLPVRAQPPLKPVPEEPSVGAQGSHMPSAPMQQVSQSRSGQSMVPQGQGRGALPPKMMPQTHVQMQQQRPVPASGQAPMGPQGQFQSQVYHQQQQKPTAPGPGGYNQGHMMMRPLNPNAAGGQIQPQQRLQGQPQAQPHPASMPSSNGARPSSGSFTGQPMFQPAQGRGGAIPHQMQMNPQGRGQFPTQPPMANPAGPMPQQVSSVVPPGGQMQGSVNPMQGRPMTQGQPGQQRQGHIQQTAPVPAQAQNMMSFAQRQQAQPQPKQAGPAPVQNMMPQGGSQAQTAAQGAPGVAPAANAAATGNANGGGHKKSWSKGKVDYEGGDWGDAW